MHTHRKAWMGVCAALLSAVLLSGCTGTDEKDGQETLYLFNSKGENAEQFQQMCDDFTAETGIPTNAFSVGSGQDAIEPLRAQMNSKNPPAIFSMQGIKELHEWKESGRALDLTTVTDPDFKQIVDGIPADLRLTTDGQAIYGIPYNVEGYGFMVDSQMIADLFGADNAEAVIAALRDCSYEEFQAFCEAADAYIEAPSAASVALSGNTFQFLPQKTGRAQKLTGVFAFAGSEDWTYGDHLVNVALNAVFATAAEANAATDTQLDSLQGPLTAYAEALDFITQHVGGLKGATPRGSDLISAAGFGYDQSVQMYADGNDIFLQQGNWAAENIAKVDAEVANRSSFIPIKLPLTDDMIKTGKTAAEFNRCIPVYAPNYYAINAKASETAQQNAIRFLTWMQKPENVQKYIVGSFRAVPYNATPDTELTDSLSKSILQYMQEGRTLSAPYHGTPGTWSSDVLGRKLMEEYLTKADWTEADYAAIAEYGISTWKERKAAQS